MLADAFSMGPTWRYGGVQRNAGLSQDSLALVEDASSEAVITYPCEQATVIEQRPHYAGAHIAAARHCIMYYIPHCHRRPVAGAAPMHSYKSNMNTWRTCVLMAARNAGIMTGKVAGKVILF